MIKRFALVSFSIIVFSIILSFLTIWLNDLTLRLKMDGAEVMLLYIFFGYAMSLTLLALGHGEDIAACNQQSFDRYSDTTLRLASLKEDIANVEDKVYNILGNTKSVPIIKHMVSSVYKDLINDDDMNTLPKLTKREFDEPDVVEQKDYLL